MAEGFAQGFASGFGLVGDVFKEQRREEAQARAEKFQREEFTERKRLNELAAAEREKDRATRASEFAAVEKRLGLAEERLARAQEEQSEYNRENLSLRKLESARSAAADARAAADWADNRNRERMKDALIFGRAEDVLADRKLGPQLTSALDPSYRQALDALNTGRLNLDSLDNKTLNTILAPEIRRGVGERTRVTMNPSETDSAKRDTREVRVTNKSIRGVDVVPNSNGNLVTLNLLVEGVDGSGNKVVFKQKMTAGRSVGDQAQVPKELNLRQGIDYIVVGKRSFYNAIANTPVFRNAAARYGAGMSQSDEQAIYDKSEAAHRATYKDYLDYFTAINEANPSRFEELYGNKTTPAEKAKELTLQRYGGLDAAQYASNRVNSIKSGPDSALISSMPDLDQEAEKYRSMGIDVRNDEEAINMRNQELRIQSKLGASDATPLVAYMSQALSSAKGRPITRQEFSALEGEIFRIASSQRVSFSGENAANTFASVVNTAVNNLTRTEQADDRQLSPIARGIK